MKVLRLLTLIVVLLTLLTAAPGVSAHRPVWGEGQLLEIENLTTSPETGTYYMAIWNPDGATGKYVLDTGTVEVFSPLDLFAFPIWWVQVHLFFGHAPQMTAALVAVLMVIGAVAAIRRAHRLGRLRVTVGDVQ